MRSIGTSMIALAAMSLLALVGIPGAGFDVAGALPPAGGDTGFTQPFLGPPQYVRLAPTEVMNPDQLHQPIGQRAADAIAAQLGLSKKDVFSEQQYVEFISGQGAHGSGKPDQAALVDASVRIFTNTVGRPLLSNVDGRITPSVLASYGLFVNTGGMLESLANTDAPTRKANAIIEKGGYLDTWCKANRAERSLAALYRSAFPAEVAYGTASQHVSGVAQLVGNSKGGGHVEVGMSMVPSIWFVNFLLLYLLNPSVAAEMPARWAPIPSNVADAIGISLAGQVPYGQYASDLP